MIINQYTQLLIIYNKFDIKDLKVNKNEDHLLFINKNDGSLWSINIGNILESGDQVIFIN